MTLTAIAIDDEQVALSIIRTHAAQVPFLDIRGYFTDPFEALDYLQKEKVDLLFLDIRMPDISGLELMATLPGAPMVIFTTAYSEHAVQSFELDALDYLLKPFSFERFLKACNKAKALQVLIGQRSKSDVPAHIMLKSGYEQYKVMLDDILYLESAGNYINFVLKDKRILSRLSMQEALALLPPAQFTRVHRSFIVANNKIDKVDRSSLYIGSVAISIGAAYALAVGEIFG
ncbi:LytR/AlgR family response regulator transcription factor [Chitinophaga pinensis]|uniref:Two component transcriptional regulator, LytTR family n=1 Tax=Chitinophaga pinensis (strain ATCC 43595 / DSM 2588 / LMG 13176 / NBRC 15968 / NCIMB 11800 / UQM 2034) TaxID=485918 RepID=A0A979GCG5_CHIPD|nr:LytTR family DNA-binding domain-containing protein [Chitinophaga pinensis]ACU64697.1 two component transcriptional regulator, LytTR family [Chitinophaga pinensis DSM 2588]